MTRITPLSTADAGFDLALGERGLLEVQRYADKRSATVLVRGTPGAGKSALALHLALVAARARGVGVAYACVEILPAELQALSEGLWPERAVRFVSHAKPTEANEVVARFIANTATLEDFAEQLDALIEATAPTSGPVLVIDSLLREATLGSAASRELIDAICKYAVEKGAILFLVEESLEGASPWMWSVDTVLELSQPIGQDTTSERALVVAKHRFGPCDPGPHRWVFTKQGVSVFPRTTTYLRPWIDAVPRGQLSLTSDRSAWGRSGPDRTICAVSSPTIIGISAQTRQWMTTLSRSLTTVHGAHAALVSVGLQEELAPRSANWSHVGFNSTGNSIERDCWRLWQHFAATKARIAIIGDVRRIPSNGSFVAGFFAFLEGVRRSGVDVILTEITEVDPSVNWMPQQSALLQRCELNIAVKALSLRGDGKMDQLGLSFSAPADDSEKYVSIQ